MIFTLIFTILWTLPDISNAKFILYELEDMFIWIYLENKLKKKMKSLIKAKKWHRPKMIIICTLFIMRHYNDHKAFRVMITMRTNVKSFIAEVFLISSKPSKNENLNNGHFLTFSHINNLKLPIILTKGIICLPLLNFQWSYLSSYFLVLNLITLHL